MSSETEIEFVALHRAEVSTGGMGIIVAPRAAVEAATDLKAIDAMSSVFKASGTMVAGGVYRSHGEIEGGRITRLGIKSARYVGIAKVDEAWRGYWQGVEAEIKAAADRVTAERKAKADKVAGREVESIARIVARLPYRQRRSFVDAIRNAILAEADRIAK